MKKSKKMTRREAILLVVIGLIMGTVFTFGTKYWNAPITQNEAHQVNATFSSYKEAKRRGRVQEIIMRFNDHEQLYIDGVCIDDELRDVVSKIEDGTLIKMMVHPNSNVILEMEVETIKILGFQDSINKLSAEAAAFMYLGIFCYVSAVIGMIHLIRLKNKYMKTLS